MTLEEAIEQFNTELPLEIQEEFGSPAVIKALENLGTQYGVDLSGLAVYFAIGEITAEGLASSIENEFDFEPMKAQKLARELRETVFDPLVNRLNFLNADPNKAMPLEQEKFFAERIFRSGLLTELDGSPIIIDAINNRLFFILARDDSFKKKLEQALYENDERLTSDDIMLNGQPVRPTVGNWLKDFIGRYGSQASDSVSQSAFLINSENGRRLDDYERDRLAEVLKTYINIKFFPDSMPSDDGEGWAIIPGGTVEASVNESATEEAETAAQSRAASPAPAAPAAKPTPAPKPRAPQPVAQPAPAAIPADDSEVMKLKNMLLQYPAGSLERKAIEEELQKHSS